MEELKKDEMWFWGVDEMAKFLGIGKAGVRWRVRRSPESLPRPFRLGGSQRARLAWRVEDVRAWLDQQARAAGANYADHYIDQLPHQCQQLAEVTPRRRRGRPRKEV